MAAPQIADLMHAVAVFDAARHDLARAYSGNFSDVPENLEAAVHTISEMLKEVERRCWVISTTTTTTTTREERLAAEEATKIQTDQIQCISEWLAKVNEVANDMRAMAHKKLLAGSTKDANKQIVRCLPYFPGTARACTKDDNKQSARCLPRLPRSIDTVAERLEELKKQYASFRYATCTEQPCADQGTSTDAPPECERAADKERIIGIITEAEYSRCGPSVILPILGPTAIGKTTMAKWIYGDPRFRDYLKAWFDMRQGHDSNKIYTSIFRASGQCPVPVQEGNFCISKMVDNIRKMLEEQNKKLLLVLDDLTVESGVVELCNTGNPIEHNLHHFLKLTSNIATVIVTTRSQRIADCMCWENNIYKPYQLCPLSDMECWAVIKRTSGFQETPADNQEAAETERVGLEIARKCGGLPLAAKALGRMLKSMDPQQWPTLLRDSPDIWSIGGSYSADSLIVFSQLKQRNDLSHLLWLSFAACAFALSNRSSIDKLDLSIQLDALGTHVETDAAIRQLFVRSLLRQQPAPTADEVDDDYDKAAMVVTMDQLMHSLARYSLGDRLIVVDGRNGATPALCSIAYFAVVSNWVGNRQLPDFGGVLALRFEACKEMELSDNVFAAFAKHLRVLNLSGCHVKKLPDSIGGLKQLRYLNAPGIEDEVFPCSIISGLHELRYLSLRGSVKLTDLSKRFGRLSKLVYLDLSGCSELKALPDSFGMLWRLQRLDLSGCSAMEALPDSFCLLRRLSHLQLSRCRRLQKQPQLWSHKLGRLRHLDLSGCSGLVARPWSLGKLEQLRHLDLSGCAGLELPNELELPELRHLNLSGCSGLIQLPHRLGLPKLRHLNLSGCLGLKQLPDSLMFARGLRHLDLSGLSELKQLPTKYHHIEELEHLNLSGCSVLRDVPSKWVKKLVYLDVTGCSDLCYDGFWEQLEPRVKSGLCSMVPKINVTTTVPEQASKRRSSSTGSEDDTDRLLIQRNPLSMNPFFGPKINVRKRNLFHKGSITSGLCSTRETYSH
ncbi:hypothetical protein ACP70R_040783 [Stipagrostis hirtigluma subsp. patula]